MEIIPLETVEQQALTHWLDLNNYVFTKIANETFTKSFKQKRKNKLEGLRAGLCDMMIILKNKKLLFIELKRQKKSLSKVSEAQKFWIEKLNEIQNVQAIVCYGCGEAIEKIKELENY